MSNFYAILECSESATYEEIKKNYQEKIRKVHPDKVTEGSPEGNPTAFIKVKEAWSTLKDFQKRKAYDAQLHAEKCENDHPIHASISWDEMNTDGVSYTYPCRCGSVYSVSEDEKDSCDTDILVECPECSFNILIKLPQTCS